MRDEHASQPGQRSRKLSRDKAPHCGRGPVLTSKVETNTGNHTVFSLCTRCTTSKAPAGSDSNNSVLNPRFMTRQHHLLNIHSIHSTRGSLTGCAKVDGTVSVLQGERERQKNVPDQNQNQSTSSRYLRHGHQEELAKITFIMPPIIPFLWSWVSHRTCLCPFVRL